MQNSKSLVFSGFEGFSPVMSGLQEVMTNKRKGQRSKLRPGY